MRRTLLFLTLLAALTAQATRAADLTAGPMVGHVTDKSARLWMQFPVAGEVTVSIFEIEQPQPVSQIRVGLEGPLPFTCDIPIGNLQPDSSYRITVKLDGQSLRLPAPDLVIRTAPSPGQEATFSIAFGSNLAVAPVAPTTQPAPRAALRSTPSIFDAITSLKPRAFLFLGNTGYLPPHMEDFPTTHRAAFRFIADFDSRIRRLPDLQELLRTTPCYALLGERDFGPRNADKSFVFAQESLVAFERFWPNPDWGTPQDPGCYCTFTFGDADFFLLDTHTFRDAPAAPNAALLGNAQIEWLKKAIKASTATFKIIAAPCALWGDDPAHPDPDAWSRYPAEQLPFMQWLADNQINGIIALAGNQPAGQLTKLDHALSLPAKPLQYPLFTLGSSTLITSPDTPNAKPSPNANRIGNPIAENTFGTLDFVGQREHRFVTLRIHDATGKTRIEQTLFASQLHGN